MLELLNQSNITQKMNILIATDKFKGSVSAFLATSSLATGLLRANRKFNISQFSLADGGEGSLEILSGNKSFKKIKQIASNQIGELILPYYLTKDNTAYIEMASVCGLQLTPFRKTSPMDTSTFEVGMMIKNVINHGFKDIILFAGGTSTNDGGMGIASALGIKFRDKKGNILEPNGRNLAQVTFIDASNSTFPSDAKITICSDVVNKLYGKGGAAYVYAKQKGATEEEIKELDLGLENLAKIINYKYDIDLQSISGTGAAGGVAACLIPFCKATIQSGSDVIIDFLDLESKISNCDVLITGEGKVDHQSLQGKIVSKVTSFSKKHNIRTILVAGQCELSASELESLGVSENFTVLNQAENDLDSAMTNTIVHLVEIGEIIGEVLSKR